MHPSSGLHFSHLLKFFKKCPMPNHNKVSPNFEGWVCWFGKLAAPRPAAAPWRLPSALRRPVRREDPSRGAACDCAEAGRGDASGSCRDLGLACRTGGAGPGRSVLLGALGGQLLWACRGAGKHGRRARPPQRHQVPLAARAEQGCLPAPAAGEGGSSARAAFLHVPHPQPPLLGSADPLSLGRAPSARRGEQGLRGGNVETESCLVPGLEKNLSLPPSLYGGRDWPRKSGLAGPWLLAGQGE